MKKFMSLALALIVVLFSCVGAVCETDGAELTLLFTSDIHSNVQPRQTSLNGEAALLGGFARLKTAVDQNRAGGYAVLFDSGDFTMGTMYQAFSGSDALELSLMGDIGYDAIALGNHDFELGESGLAEMLGLFYAGERSCPVLCSNLTQKGDKAASPEAEENPMRDAGIRNYAVIERGGFKIGVFALIGSEAMLYTPVETLAFAEPIETAKAIVKKLREEEQADLVVMLSHCGTIPGIYEEDADIAKAVPGIDVILSGHKHKAIFEAEQANDTLIVGAGTALTHLGKLVLGREGGKWVARSYELIPLDETFADDPSVASAIAPYAAALDAEYGARYGLSEGIREPFAASNASFPSGDDMNGVGKCKDYAFGKLIGDAYQTAIRELCGKSAQIVAEPVGVIRNGLYAGEWSITDIYNTLSYGTSPVDGSSASPIALIYLSGAELYDLCEASVSLSPFIDSAQILFGGLRFAYCDARPFLDKVYSVEIRDAETGEYAPISRNDTELYSVAASWTTCQSVSLITKKSFGLLSLVPKNELGEPLDTDEKMLSGILTYSLESGETRELKEWYAMYHFLRGMPKDENGLHRVPDSYGEAGGYLIEGEPGFVNFFRNPSRFAWILLAAIAVVLLIIGLAAYLIVRLCRKSRARKMTAA